MNREAEINGREVKFDWNQIYSEHQRYVLLEVEVPAGANGEKRLVATATVTYANMSTNVTDTLSDSVEISYSDSEDRIRAAENKEVVKDYVAQSVATARDEAVKLRDQGNIADAKMKLFSAGRQAESVGMDAVASELAAEAEAVQDGASWNDLRKSIRARSNSTQNQQISAPVK
jgi:Ca-activated chloride channel family protein